MNNMVVASYLRIQWAQTGMFNTGQSTLYLYQLTIRLFLSIIPFLPNTHYSNNDLYMKLLYVCCSKINAFRDLHENLAQDPNEVPLANNFRTVQPLNGRLVYRSFDITSRLHVRNESFLTFLNITKYLFSRPALLSTHLSFSS